MGLSPPPPPPPRALASDIIRSSVQVLPSSIQFHRFIQFICLRCSLEQWWSTVSSHSVFVFSSDISYYLYPLSVWSIWLGRTYGPPCTEKRQSGFIHVEESVAAYTSFRARLSVRQTPRASTGRRLGLELGSPRTTYAAF